MGTGFGLNQGRSRGYPTRLKVGGRIVQQRVSCPNVPETARGSEARQHFLRVAAREVDQGCRWICKPILFQNLDLSGCGSVWLERLVRDQEVAGSNPVTPTCENPRKPAFSRGKLGFSRFLASAPASAILSGIASDLHEFSAFGASIGASETSRLFRRVPVALAAVRVLSATVKRQVRQRFHGARHVEQSRVGVDVHRQVDGRMPHRGLCRSRVTPRPLKGGAEGVPQGVNVNRPPPVVPSSECRRAAGPGRESAPSRSGTSKSGVSAGKPEQPLASLPFRPPESACIASVRFAVLRVETNGRRFLAASWRAFALSASHCRRSAARSGRRGTSSSFAVLFVGGVEHQVSRVGVEVQLPHGERSQFAFAKPGQTPASCTSRPVPVPAVRAGHGFGSQVRQTACRRPVPGGRSSASSSGRRRATSSSRTSSASVSARRCRAGRLLRRPSARRQTD